MLNQKYIIRLTCTTDKFRSTLVINRKHGKGISVLYGFSILSSSTILFSRINAEWKYPNDAETIFFSNGIFVGSSCSSLDLVPSW